MIQVFQRNKQQVIPEIVNAFILTFISVVTTIPVLNTIEEQWSEICICCNLDFVQEGLEWLVDSVIIAFTQIPVVHWNYCEELKNKLITVPQLKITLNI